MIQKLFYIALIIFPLFLKAQLTENFSDGDFTANPAWTGDAAQFKVNTSFQLQLNSTGEAISALATPFQLSDSTEWRFWIKLSFAPSDNNLAKVYLMSDNSDLKNALNGYFLKFGENNANDAIELYRQDGQTATLVGRGTDGFIAASFAVSVKVKRSSAGKWSVFADAAGGENYSLQFTATDNSITASSWFGVMCKYTTSNSTKFYFDNFYAGAIQIDNTAPEVSSVIMATTNSLFVKFSESVNPASATAIQNYSVDNGIGNPVSAVADALDGSKVTLTFSQDFQSDIQYNINISGIKDLAGNTMTASQHSFAQHVVHQFDVLVNEIMADPNPVVYLPDWEYVELYNRSAYPINLANWKIQVGSSAKTLPDFTLQPHSYVILADADAATDLGAYGDFLGFSSMSITNTGGTIALYNEQGLLIHMVNYSDDWYGTDYKKDGGWSLEMIDPFNPCGEASNWIASNDANGGTPGKINQANAENPDLSSPFIQSIGVENDSTILLSFSEVMDSASLAIKTNYMISNGIGSPVSVLLYAPTYKMVKLSLQNHLQSGIIYKLTFTGNLSDCAGNLVAATTEVELAIPGKPSAGDIVINEIMFNPKDESVDFIELYNRSGSVFDFRDLLIANYDSTNNLFTSVNNISLSSYLFMPARYVVISTDSAAILKYYHSENPKNFMNIEHMPTMNNDMGNVALALYTGDLIDQVNYTEEMQYPLLGSFDGVSLERINPAISSLDKNNWHSASSVSGYATPAYKNSQFSEAISSDGEISVSPAIFTPDNDGTDDVLNINYTFTQPGFSATVSIFDANGNPVRQLVNNEITGTSGTFIWDGTTDNHTKAGIGRYIIFVKVFDLNGKGKQYRKTAVLGGKF